MAKRSASGIVIGGITVEVERDIRHSSRDAFCRDSPPDESGKIDEQLFWRHGERLRQFDDVFQGHVPFAALDAADVVAVQISSLRQLFLGIAPFLTEPAHRGTKAGFDRARAHPPMLEW